MDILIVSPDKNDLTSFYRSHGVFSYLRKHHMRGKLNIVYPDTFNNELGWPVLANVDMLFIQRPFNNRHKELILMAKKMRMPVWIDYDDDLFNVPHDNNAFDLYANSGTRQTIKDILSYADVVTVSTNELAEQYKKHVQGSLVVINNAFNNYFCQPRKSVIKQQKIVYWRGTESHRHDLIEVTPHICRLAVKHPDWTFLFQGFKPFWLIQPNQGIIPPELKNEKFTNIKHMSGLLPIDYFLNLQNINPAITIVPLHESSFNRCKSNIVSYESHYAGAGTLAPDWEEWRNPGTITYNGMDDFEIKLDEILQNKYDLMKLQDDGWKWVQQNRYLSQINTKRMDIIKKIEKQLK